MQPNTLQPEVQPTTAAPRYVPKSLTWTVGANLLLDAAAALYLLYFFGWSLANSGGVDGGFVAIFGFVYLFLAMIPVGDGYILLRLYRRKSWGKLWSYFAASRTLILFFATYSLYQYAVYESTFPQNRTILYTALLAILMAVSLLGVSLYRQAKSAWKLLVLLAAVSVSLFGALYVNMSVARSETTIAAGGLAGARRDNQTARDFQLLSQDIQNYSFGGSMPASLNQVVGSSSSYNSEENVASRINRYAYKHDDAAGTFDLCATFSTDTTKSEPAVDNPTKAYRHRSGYQCFTFEASGQVKNNQKPAAQQGVQIYN